MNTRLFSFFLCCSFFSMFSVFIFAAEPNDPNYYSGTDSERIAQAVAASAKMGGVVRIPARVPDEKSPRTFWLIDSAILLPANTTLIIENCVIKLSNLCRDNFIRSANCGIGISEIEPISNVHVLGVGRAELIGADDPRATGDSGKVLGERTYGTDAGREGESQRGDWRNIGVLFAWVNHFSVRNITIRDAHAWAMSFERCAFGKITDITFDASEKRLTDKNGKSFPLLNQDGLDIRQGCHDIVIDTIQGGTGDDTVALTAIRSPIREDGLLEKTEVSGPRTDGRENDIWNITIRNIVSHSRGGHQIIRLLNGNGTRIHHVILDGVIDNSPEDGVRDRATVRIGDSNPNWGGITPLGDTYAITLTNIQSRAKAAVLIAGSLTDSVISNVINLNPNCEPVTYESGKERVKNVVIQNVLSVEKENQ
ncbi:MAG: hypothetical protein E7028_09930 [Planctomycetaceae bacterium]|nr:hypothetical protein [Planctomycetaceae bacterium]